MKDSRRPTREYIKEFVNIYNTVHPFDNRAYIAAMNLISAFPTNQRFEEIFIKVNFINGAFKTRIGDTLQVAINISNITNLDRRIKANDFTLIDEIGNYSSKNDREFKFYSFATKYCHCHNPNSFSIFDNYVKTSLEFYRNQYKDAPQFASYRLRDYVTFSLVIQQFKMFANSFDLNLSTIDRFLWAQSKPD